MSAVWVIFPLSPAHLPTRVRDELPSAIFRVPYLSTEAVVSVGNVLGHILTSGTPPSRLFIFGSGRPRPLLDASHVEEVVTIGAVPNRVLWSNTITTHHALVRSERQLVLQYRCLTAIVRWNNSNILLLGFVNFAPISL